MIVILWVHHINIMLDHYRTYTRFIVQLSYTINIAFVEIYNCNMIKSYNSHNNHG